MALEQATENAERTLDEIFKGGQEKLSRDGVMTAMRRATVAPDLMYYFDRLPEGEYTREKLVQTVNRMIQELGRQREIGELK